MTLIADASLVVAALINDDAEGNWARRLLASDQIEATQNLPAEVANALRRRERAGEISEEIASVAHGELLAMTIALRPYELYADRVWQLRHSVSIYDAWCVALAEVLDAPLATLDLRLTRAIGPRCQFLTP